MIQFSVAIHWNKNVVILTKFSSLAALEVVILTTSSAASDEHFIKMKTFPFQCMASLVRSELTQIANTKAVDDLATQGSGTSTATASTYIVCNNGC